MNSNAVLKLIKYAKAALRHAVIIGLLVLLCFGITRPNHRLFASWLFLPLAAFITIAYPAYTEKKMLPESLIAFALVVFAHFLIVGSAKAGLVFILLYAAAGALGAGFGTAVRKLGKRDVKKT
ncbi:MAG: hypothetical protein K6B54_01880 [Clostridia bacterium]|nr:hypothetical protein [Clostridia bacterium]